MKTKNANRNPLRARPPKTTHDPKTTQDQDASESVAVVARYARTTPVLQFVMDMGEALKASQKVST